LYGNAVYGYLQSVIHADIKPENVLLASDTPLNVKFGTLCCVVAVSIINQALI
jgi:hypothetical protein